LTIHTVKLLFCNFTHYDQHRAFFNYDKLKLHRTYVLNPIWLTNAVYCIINSPTVKNASGGFNINVLPKIIDVNSEDNAAVEEDKLLFIVAMMKEFELIYQIDDENYVVPDLLPIEQNVYEFKSVVTLKFIVEYSDFLPAAIIPRLMVKMHKYIYRNQVWKTGMVLEEKILFQSIGNIVLDKESRRIIIRLAGKRKRDFLTIIRNTIEEINVDYQELKTTEWVPLPDLLEEEECLVKYNELLGCEEVGEEYYFSGELRKKYLVGHLLDGIESHFSRAIKKAVPSKINNKCKIFISYCREDVGYMKALEKHLKPLERLQKVEPWHDGCIVPGEKWEEKIFGELRKSSIVLCLVSSDFIASDFCQKELKEALTAHENGEQEVIPIKIRPCYWDGLPISELQGLPRKKDSWLKNESDDATWTEIIRSIEKVVDRMNEPKA